MPEITITKKCGLCGKLYNGNKDSAFCGTCTEALLFVVDMFKSIKEIQQDESKMEEINKLMQDLNESQKNGLNVDDNLSGVLPGLFNNVN